MEDVRGYLSREEFHFSSKYELFDTTNRWRVYLKNTRRGALDNIIHIGHTALHQYKSKAEKQWGLHCVRHKGSEGKYPLVLAALPPLLGGLGEMNGVKDFMGAAVFLLLISKTYLACVTGNDSHRWWGYWSQTWSHRSSEILALHALPKEEEQCLGPYDTHTKPASVCKWVIWAWSVILECVFLLGTLLKCSQCAPH